MKLRRIGFVEAQPAVIDPYASGVDDLDLGQRNLDALAEPDLQFRRHGVRRHYPSDRRDGALESRMGRRIAREDRNEDRRQPERHTTTKSAHNICSPQLAFLRAICCEPLKLPPLAHDRNAKSASLVCN